MSPAVTREWSVTYGTLTVGGASDYLLDSYTQLEMSPETFGFTFDLVVAESSEADFAAACADVEALLSKRDQAVTVVTAAGNTLFSASPSSNTGFNTRATVIKPGTEGVDTGRSRRYTVAITGQRPASDDAGLRDLSVKVLWDDSYVQSIVLSGTYTAVGGSSASEKFDSSFDARAASIVSSIGDGFEQIGQETDRDRLDKVMTFSRVYRQIIYNQDSGTLDHDAIQNQTLTFARASIYPGDSESNLKRLDDVRANWSCAIDKNETTDVDALWTDTVFPYIKAEFSRRFSPTSFGIALMDRNFDNSANRLTASVVFRAAIDVSGVVEVRVTMGMQEDPALTMTGVWDGNPYSYFVDYGKALRQRTTEAVVVTLGAEPPASPTDTKLGAGATKQGPTGSSTGTGRWILGPKSSKATPLFVGDGEDQLHMTALVTSIIEVYVEEPATSEGVTTGGEQPDGSGETPDPDNPVTTPSPPDPGAVTPGGNDGYEMDRSVLGIPRFVAPGGVGGNR